MVALSLSIERAAPPVLKQLYVPSCCLAAAPIALSLFEANGFRGDLAPAELTLMSPKYHEIFARERRLPTAEEVNEAQAASICVGQRGRTTLPGEWPGHLVAVIERKLLVDLSIHQATESSVDFVAPDFHATFVDEDWLGARRSVGTPLENGWFAYYIYRPELIGSWTAASIWRDLPRRQLATQRIAEEMARSRGAS